MGKMSHNKHFSSDLEGRANGHSHCHDHESSTPPALEFELPVNVIRTYHHPNHSHQSSFLILQNGKIMKTKHLESSAGPPADDAILLESFNYICSLPGKQIRTKLALAFNAWLKVEPHIMEKVSDIVEVLHNASLLIDDIQDGSELRRGQPVAHAIFGVAQTINSANYAYFIALERVLGLKHPKAVEVFTEQLLELHRGQGMEIYWRDSFKCPTEAEYRDTIVKKTGGLFMLAIRLLQLFSNDQRDLKKIVSLLGLYFQIRDDYANLRLAEYCENKSFCEDLTEGKFSFPVIHAIHSNPEDTQIQCILKQHTKNIDLKRYFVTLLQKSGSLAYTENALRELQRELREEIEILGGNTFLISLLDELNVTSPVNGSGHGHDGFHHGFGHNEKLPL